MGISIYYNINHHCFKCDYSPSTSSKFKEPYSIDGHNIMFLCYIPFKNISYCSPILSIRKIIGNLFINFGNRIIPYQIKNDRRSNYWYRWKR